MAKLPPAHSALYAPVVFNNEWNTCCYYTVNAKFNAGSEIQRNNKC
jgi:hypothetical protein